jgi:hypothetical protein
MRLAGFLPILVALIAGAFQALRATCLIPSLI